MLRGPSVVRQSVAFRRGSTPARPSSSPSRVEIGGFPPAVRTPLLEHDTERSRKGPACDPARFQGETSRFVGIARGRRRRGRFSNSSWVASRRRATSYGSVRVTRDAHKVDAAYRSRCGEGSCCFLPAVSSPPPFASTFAQRCDTFPHTLGHPRHTPRPPAPPHDDRKNFVQTASSTEIGAFAPLPRTSGLKTRQTWCAAPGPSRHVVLRAPRGGFADDVDAKTVDTSKSNGNGAFCAKFEVVRRGFSWSRRVPPRPWTSGRARDTRRGRLRQHERARLESTPAADQTIAFPPFQRTPRLETTPTRCIVSVHPCRAGSGPARACFVGDVDARA